MVFQVNMLHRIGTRGIPWSRPKAVLCDRLLLSALYHRAGRCAGEGCVTLSPGAQIPIWLLMHFPFILLHEHTLGTLFSKA